jgi:hypothetical protein
MVIDCAPPGVSQVVGQLGQDHRAGGTMLELAEQALRRLALRVVPRISGRGRGLTVANAIRFGGRDRPVSRAAIAGRDRVQGGTRNARGTQPPKPQANPATGPAAQLLLRAGRSSATFEQRLLSVSRFCSDRRSSKRAPAGTSPRHFGCTRWRDHADDPVVRR